MKHIRLISSKPETAQTNFQALIDFVVGVVNVFTEALPVGIQMIFNKTGGAIR